MRSTLEVIQNHGKAFRKGLDAVVEDYAEDAVLISPSGVHKGHEQIRRFFEQEILNFPEGFWKALETERFEVEGEYGYFLWKALPWYSLGCDSFHVRDGKIRFQTSTI